MYETKTTLTENTKTEKRERDQEYMNLSEKKRRRKKGDKNVMNKNEKEHKIKEHNIDSSSSDSDSDTILRSSTILANRLKALVTSYGADTIGLKRKHVKKRVARTPKSSKSRSKLPEGGKHKGVPVNRKKVSPKATNDKSSSSESDDDMRTIVSLEKSLQTLLQK